MKSVLLFLMFIHFGIKAQTFQWALQEHYSTQCRSESVGTDKWGEVYITGRFIPSYNNVGGSTYGGIVSKYTSFGNLVWTDTILNVRQIKSVVDSLGNIYMTGYFINSATFGSFTLNSNYLGGFLVKYNQNGQCLWAKNMWGFGIALGPHGGIYTTASNNSLLTRFDNNGNIIWSVYASLNNSPYAACSANAVTVDKNGNAYLTGQFADTVTWGAGTNSITLAYNGPYRNNYIAKYDSSGIFKWIKADANPSYGFDSQNPFYLSLDTIGNPVITCTFFNVLGFSSSTYSTGNTSSILLGKYNTNGVLLWYKSISNITVNDIQNNNINDRLYLTGGFGGTVALGNGVTMSSSCAAFISEFDNNGNAQWVIYPMQSNTGCSTGLSLTTDKLNALYMVGEVSGSNTAFGTTTLSTPQYPDMFLTQIKDLQTNTSLNNSFLKNNLISIYPNPTIDHITISSTEIKTAEIKISNILGQCVYSKHCKANGELNERVPMSTYPKGIYLVEITTDKGKEVKKVVVE